LPEIEIESPEFKILQSLTGDDVRIYEVQRGATGFELCADKNGILVESPIVLVPGHTEQHATDKRWLK
jgi:hypothetical protein